MWVYTMNSWSCRLRISFYEFFVVSTLLWYYYSKDCYCYINCYYYCLNLISYYCSCYLTLCVFISLSCNYLCYCVCLITLCYNSYTKSFSLCLFCSFISFYSTNISNSFYNNIDYFYNPLISCLIDCICSCCYNWLSFNFYIVLCFYNNFYLSLFIFYCSLLFYTFIVYNLVYNCFRCYLDYTDCNFILLLYSVILFISIVIFYIYAFNCLISSSYPSN